MVGVEFMFLAVERRVLGFVLERLHGADALPACSVAAALHNRFEAKD